jgi:Holliday junction resolvase RusA-like endonuclease
VAKKIELTLPVPPSVNRIWRRGKGKGMYKTPKAKEYGEAVYAAALTQGVKRVAFGEGVPVRYTLTWYRATATGDLSNRLKLLEDSLNGIVWADDKQIVEFHCYRKEAPRKGRIEIIIEEAQ